MEEKDALIDFDLEFDFNDFSPVAAAFEDEEDPLAIACAQKEDPSFKLAVEEDRRTPQKKLEDLMRDMASHRKVFLSILAFCAERQPVAAVNKMCAATLENVPSVYSPANLTNLLERNEGLMLVTRDGTPFSELDLEPEKIIENGVAYIKPQKLPEGFWQTTEAGAYMVERNDPLARARQMLEEQERYAPIYARVLEMCACGQGAATQDIEEEVNGDSLLENPRLLAPYFLDQLEKAEAVEWRKRWYATDLGLEVLASIVANDAEAAR